MRRDIARVKQKRLLDQMGLRLSGQALRMLKERGIFAPSAISLEHQLLATRYVIRGMESGGAVGDLGRYVTFAPENGQPIEYLHPADAIGVNGLHAVVIATVLVRVEMLRTAVWSWISGELARPSPVPRRQRSIRWQERRARPRSGFAERSGPLRKR